jgi:hypothetical protein
MIGCDWKIDLVCQDVSGRPENSRKRDFSSGLRVTQGDCISQANLSIRHGKTNPVALEENRGVRTGDEDREK